MKEMYLYFEGTIKIAERSEKNLKISFTAYVTGKNCQTKRINNQKQFFFYKKAVSILVWNSETNTALASSTITIGGINYTAPVVKTFVRGTVLNMLAYKTGYTLENRTIDVQDTSTTGAATQQFIFLLSATLVRIFHYTDNLF